MLAARQRALEEESAPAATETETAEPVATVEAPVVEAAVVEAPVVEAPVEAEPLATEAPEATTETTEE